MKKLFTVGDVHGDVARLHELLVEVGLIEDTFGEWIGGDSTLVFIGDLTDRGPDGVGVITFVRGLQEQASDEGGRVEVIVGNHDALLLSRVYSLRGEYDAGEEVDYWFMRNGGDEQAARYVDENINVFDWMVNRPLLLNINGFIFQHADSLAFYRMFSGYPSINAMNDACFEALCDPWTCYNKMFGEMTEARYWHGLKGEEMQNKLTPYLTDLDGHTIVHGHTRHVMKEAVYSHNGQTINVDGSLSCAYTTDPNRGFILELK